MIILKYKTSNGSKTGINSKYKLGIYNTTHFGPKIHKIGANQGVKITNFCGFWGQNV